jgi:hypothetical protein
MPALKYVTLSYDGRQGDVEFVACCKGRPFSILTAPNFPTPDVTLVDYNLVRDLRLTMTDLQCAKFHYGGHKLRILGKISTTVQCISDGSISGNLHFKATVIQDLYQTFDTHSIAGNKLSRLLLNPPSQLDDDHTEPTETPKRKKKKPKPNRATPSNSSTPKSQKSEQYLSPGFSLYNSPSLNQMYGLSPSSTTPSSPPGFPTPVYGPKVRPHLPMQPDNQRSPLTVNIARLTAAFGSADLIDNLDDEQAALAHIDPFGTFDIGNSGGSFDFSKSHDPASYNSAIRGPLYRSGHGRRWCSIACRNDDDAPHNCGFHPQWRLPPGFQCCSQLCKGGLCECLSGHQDYGYYG